MKKFEDPLHSFLAWAMKSPGGYWPAPWQYAALVLLILIGQSVGWPSHSR